MIEINLLPGSAKRKKRGTGGGLSLKLPTGGLGEIDRLGLFNVAAWVLGPALILWLFLSVRAEKADVGTAIDQAVADSTRYARLIATQAALRARQDTIAQKLTIIQDIDAGRFIWPHVLDEISRALPDYTWITGISQLEGGTTPRFQIDGRSASYPALTRFWDDLRASPFIDRVDLVSSEQTQLQDNKVVNDFILVGTYEQPSLEAIETVPLFEEEMMDTTAAAAAGGPNGTGTS